MIRLMRNTLLFLCLWQPVSEGAHKTLMKEEALAPIPKELSGILADISKSPFESSIKAVGSARLWHSLPQKMPSSERQKILLPTLLRKKLKYDVYRNSNSKRWLVFNPGLFSYLSAPYVKYMVKTLYQFSYNILVIPNSFTHRYLRSDPTFSIGDIEKESLVVCAIIKKVMGQEGLSSPMPMIGASYGGLLSSASAAQCTENISKLIVINPPLELHKTLNIISQWLHQSQQNPLKFKNLIASEDWFLFAKAQLGFPENYRNLFVKFFHKGFSYTIRNYYRYSSDVHDSRQLEIGGMDYNSPEYREWESQLNIKSFFSLSLEQQNEKMASSLKLSYWLQKLTNKALPFSVFSSIDDPINIPKDWKPLLEKFSSKHIHLLQIGGHFGLTLKPEFKNYLEKQFL